jgi:flagellar biosynthesis protein FlhF
MLLLLVAGKGAGGKTGFPPALQEFHDRLCGQDVDEPIATKLITDLTLNLTGQELADRPAVCARLAELIAAQIPCVPAPAEAAGCLRGRVIALVGPTGVGKTTTIAKLAANMKLKEGKKVGLVTIDTYRIAAVDQLRTYAEIIEVPLRTVLTPQEMGRAMYAMRGLDAILIDTVGRSQNDRLRLNQLRGFLQAAEADEVHLVVAATANRRCAAKVVRQFRPLGVSHLIVTKLDEAEGCGIVLNVARDGKAPLSFISTGQEVPDDIAAADPHDLARRIVGDDDHAA